LPAGTYFADWAFPQARARGDAGYGEQSIETTLDDDLQRLAVGAVRRAKLGGAQIALVAMRPDGTVVAMIGGRSYRDSPFNRATQARRQPGSTFKLFVYLAALREGLDPDSMVEDAPLTLGNWSPRNSSGRYRGLISLREAFAVSSNVAAVRLQEQVGREKVIRAARDLGITASLTDDPSLALGTSGVSLLEMTAAYAAVAAEHRPVRPHALPGGADEGWFGSVRGALRSFQDRGSFKRLQDLLHAAANEGTGRAAALRIDTFGKTGTSQDHRDAIFIGFAGDLVTAVWVGNDDNSPLKGVEGGGLPARIWRDFMSRAVGGAPPSAAPARARQTPQLPAVNLPIEGTGIEVGIDLANEAFSISTGEDDVPPPADEDIPTIAPPPPATVPEEEEEPPF
jgi:penicillin-binding protein 1A